MFNAALYKHPTAAAAEIHRNAYNAAFCELGLSWYWDIETYRDLLTHPGERERLRVYLENRHPHLLKAYEADFLIDAIQMAKARCFDNAAAAPIWSSSMGRNPEHEVGY